MEYKDIIYGREGHVAKITLNRPEKLNAISFAVQHQILDALIAAEEDDDVKVIILKGAGRCFSSGADLGDVGFRYDEWKEPKPGEKARRPSQRARLNKDRFTWANYMMRVLLCSKVTIAQAHGYCFGSGLMLAENCDLIIGADDCQFGYVEERLGTGGSTMSPLLVYRVGLTVALELQITGKIIDGKKAEQIHLINRAVPASDLESEVDELARGIALYSRDGLAISKTVRHAVYDTLGITHWGNIGYWSHTLMTNMRWEPDEYNFMKERRDKGVKTAAHEKHERFKALDK